MSVRVYGLYGGDRPELYVEWLAWARLDPYGWRFLWAMRLLDALAWLIGMQIGYRFALEPKLVLSVYLRPRERRRSRPSDGGRPGGVRPPELTPLEVLLMLLLALLVVFLAAWKLAALAFGG